MRRPLVGGRLFYVKQLKYFANTGSSHIHKPSSVLYEYKTQRSFVIYSAVTTYTFRSKTECHINSFNISYEGMKNANIFIYFFNFFQNDP